jgi:flagellar biosynthesis protein FlhF
MHLRRFIASSAADAVTQIHTEMGSQAVVLEVRPLPRRLLGRQRFEVLATLPESPPPPSPNDERLGLLHDEIAGLKRALEAQTVKPAAAAAPVAVHRFPQLESGSDAPSMRVLLEQSGLLPLYAQCVADRRPAMPGGRTPAEELALARRVLAQFWRPAPPLSDAVQLHVFVGARGVGKTTVLCKWLAQAVLLEDRAVRVWRLDGRTANPADLLSVHAEVLGVPVERHWTGQIGAGELGFVDLPGVPWSDGEAVNELGEQVRQFPSSQVHVVLHAAYEPSLWLSQVRAFSELPVGDLIVTRLDEESRWGKLWNLVLGTNYPIRFLASGQNVPGEFVAATAEAILERQFLRK